MPSQMNGDLHSNSQVPIWNSRQDSYQRMHYLRSQSDNSAPPYNNIPYNPGCRFVYILLSLSHCSILFFFGKITLLYIYFYTRNIYKICGMGGGGGVCKQTKKNQNTKNLYPNNLCKTLFFAWINSSFILIDF